MAGGIVLSLVALAMLGVGVNAALSVIWHLVWLGLFLYPVGVVVTFWIAQSWKDGYTVNELKSNSLWFLSVPAEITKRFRKSATA